jgi:hypothetical protein
MGGPIESKGLVTLEESVKDAAVIRPLGGQVQPWQLMAVALVP